MKLELVEGLRVATGEEMLALCLVEHNEVVEALTVLIVVGGK